MVALEEEYERVANPVAVASLLDTLVESGGASLCLEGDDRRPEPVVLMEQHKGETLVLDLSSVDYLLGRLQQGAGAAGGDPQLVQVFRVPVFEHRADPVLDHV